MAPDRESDGAGPLGCARLIWGVRARARQSEARHFVHLHMQDLAIIVWKYEPDPAPSAGRLPVPEQTGQQDPPAGGTPAAAPPAGGSAGSTAGGKPKAGGSAASAAGAKPTA